ASQRVETQGKTHPGEKQQRQKSEHTIHGDGRRRADLSSGRQLEYKVKPHGIASDASREKLIEKKTDHHDRTSSQPTQPDSLDAQQQLPTHCCQDFNHAVAKPAEY